jgi:saposin
MNKLLLIVVLCCVAFVAAKPQKPHRPQTDCDICKTLIDAIESWIEDNKTISQIESDLDQVCAWVPPFAPVCDQFVAWGIPDIVNYIKNNEDPTTFCTQIGICAAKKAKAPKVSKAPKKPKDINCDMCTYVIQSMESWLEQNATVQQIEQNLETLCALIPGFTAQCDAIVLQEVPQIIQWIEQNESPNDICTQLGFCNSTRRLKGKEAVLKQKLVKPPPKQGANCFICETIITSIESWLEQNATEAQIEQYLDTLCTLVPSFQAQCDALIAQGLTQIIQWIEQNQTPQQVCTNLGLCTNSTIPYPYGRQKYPKAMKVKF